MRKRLPTQFAALEYKKNAQVEDQPTHSAIEGALPASSGKVANKLPLTLQNIVNRGLARLQDPQPEGLSTRGLQAIKTENNLGHIPMVVLLCALGLLMVSTAYYVSPYGDLLLEIFFFPGLLLIFVPITVRLLSATASRFERMCLLCIAGICFYLVQFMVSPNYVSSFDEFLHWRTAADIIRTQHLFTNNPMLPVSPYYPGLELIITGLSTISGLSIFHSFTILITLARLLMVLSLFLLYEQITRSSRMAGIATIIYMTNPHFLFFDALFNYESFALPLATFMFYLLARYQTINKNFRWLLFTGWLVLLAVTITHHMTDYVFDGLLLLWSVISLFQISSRNIRKVLVPLAFCGIVLSIAYAKFSTGNPAVGYLSSYYSSAFNEMAHIITGTSVARPLFVSSSGLGAPIWDRLLMLGSVAIIAFSLPFGLLCLWQQHRHEALAVMFGIFALFYPLTQVFRFTQFGSEITDRSAAFLFLPIAYVLSIYITHFWPTRTINRRTTVGITCLLAVVFLGGVALESGPIWSNVAGPYLVAADVRSVEPEGIQVATWTLSHLGRDNRVATDRINRLLSSTYGQQRMVTGSNDKIDVSPIFYAATLGPEEIGILRTAKIRYLVVDLRLSTSLPLIGFYFEEGEPGTYRLTKPISRAALTKFSAIPQIKQIFESGDIVIYDVGALSN